jgi:amidase
MANLDELASLSATAQGELIRRREVKPIELVDAAIGRIERLNPGLNAVVTPMFEQARAAANDDRAMGKLVDAAFPGVPFLLKDLGGAYGGVRMTSGCALLSDYVPRHDSELVARLKRAGLIVVGKTNTPEFGLVPTTEPRLFGPTLNPWNRSRTSGGSSGGSAAAVAAGMVAMAHGGDGGGSIRIPASCCGIFGLKPTRARNPLGPEAGDAMGGLVVEHALSRSVLDSAALLDATSGPDLGDPYPAPPPARPFAQEVGADPGCLRIAFTAQAFSDAAIHADCVEAVRDAAKLCESLGHELVEASPPVDGQLLNRAFISVWSAGCISSVEDAARYVGKTCTADLFERTTWALYEMGRGQTASAYLSAWTELQTISRIVARFMVNYDLLLTPTLGEPPVPLGTFEPPPENLMQGVFRALQFVPFTTISNVTGQPAMSVPLFWNREGLPVGCQFIARFGDEATLFRLAAQLEAARPWSGRHPSVSA